MKEIYDVEVSTIEGKQPKLALYNGKVVLIVSVASQCGFTGQYDGLEMLYRKYVDQGLVILDFPCNQFGAQEPGSKEETPPSPELSALR